MKQELKKLRPVRKKVAYHVGNLAPLLLAAAEEAVAEEGAANVTVKSVAHRAGVTAAAAYYHYKDRAAILSAVAAVGFEKLAKAVERNTQKGPTNPRSKAHIYIRFALRHPHLYQLMFGPDIARSSNNDALNAAKARSYEALREAVRVDLGAAADSAAIRRTALAAWSFAHGVVALLMDDNISISRGSSSDEFYDELASALAEFFDAHRRRLDD